MASHLKVLKGDLKPIHDRVIVTDMHFGEQKTSSGLIISSDDASTRGIYPRWARVFRKGPENTETYNVGDWVLVEHGRWTRGFNVDNGEEVNELRMVDPEGIIAWSTEKPQDVQFGKEYRDGEGASFNPEDFVRT